MNMEEINPPTNGYTESNKVESDQVENISSNSNSNKNNNNININCGNSKMPSKIPMRPSGIPKLNFNNTGTYRNRGPLSPSSNCSSNNTNAIGRPVSSISNQSQSPDATNIMSPEYNKRSRNYMQMKSNDSTNRHRSAVAQSHNRYDRAMSVENQLRQTSRDSSFSENTNPSSTGNSCGVITSKIGSLQNAKHKPGGGNVQIVHRKLDFSSIQPKCGSKKNMKHKPGGGDIQIFEQKLDFKDKIDSKVGSMKNVKHKPTGGDVKIENRKLEWSVESKVGSMKNVKHKPLGGQVKIVNEPLPWLQHNKPNLPPEEIARINKRTPRCNEKDGSAIISPSRSSYSNSICSEKSS